MGKFRGTSHHFTSEEARAAALKQKPKPQSHYKRIGRLGGLTNRGRRYNSQTGFVLASGRWRNPNKEDI